MPVKNRLLTWTYRHIGKPIFFRLDPEFVHDRVTGLGALLGSFPPARFLTQKVLAYHHPSLETTVAGIKFANPVGLSAGFDKDARLTGILPAVGFGFAELGSVTKLPYVGNPRPRLYRLPKSQAIVVYYGLKNDGVDQVLKRLLTNSPIPLGISVAKSNDPRTTTEATGIEDYLYSIRQAQGAPGCAYITINLSCPNTFGGEPFTTPTALRGLLGALRKQLRIDKPIFLKMPIDLPWHDFNKLLEIAVDYAIDGVIIGNLTKNRETPSIKDVIPETIKGGISGRPTFELSNNLIRRTRQAYGDKLSIVGVGGVFSADDAYTKLRLGASLVQLITGMIFEGPQLIGQINEGLVIRMKTDGFTNIDQVIGIDT